MKQHCVWMVTKYCNYFNQNLHTYIVGFNTYEQYSMIVSTWKLERNISKNAF